MVVTKLNLNLFCDDAIITGAWWIRSFASQCVASIVEVGTIIQRKGNLFKY